MDKNEAHDDYVSEVWDANAIAEGLSYLGSQERNKATSSSKVREKRPGDEVGEKVLYFPSADHRLDYAG